MPNPSKSHISLILDRSGSMGPIRDDVVGAVNTFFDDQRKVPGECSVTLVQFDDEAPYEKIYDGALTDARLDPKRYQPRGNTPLLDAVGKGIVDLGEKLAAMPEADRPGKVIFVIQTDGQENSSKEWTFPRLKALIDQQTKDYNWQFVFLGADASAFNTASQMGIGGSNVLRYSNTGRNTKSTVAACSSNIASYRGAQGQSVIDGFSDEQRADAISPQP
jgi:hypothetical protein